MLFLPCPPPVVYAAAPVVCMVAPVCAIVPILRWPHARPRPCCEPVAHIAGGSLGRLCCGFPFDLAHWLPNMPRGHEDQQRGGDRKTNADHSCERRAPIKSMWRPSCVST
jgi:hypothetical protein